MASNQPCASLLGEVVPAPLEHHQQLVIKLDQVVNVNENPDQPSREAGKSESFQVHDGGIATDNREAAHVVVLKGRQIIALEPTSNELGNVLSLLHGNGSNSR